MTEETGLVPIKDFADSVQNAIDMWLTPHTETQDNGSVELHLSANQMCVVAGKAYIGRLETHALIYKTVTVHAVEWIHEKDNSRTTVLSTNKFLIGGKCFNIESTDYANTEMLDDFIGRVFSKYCSERVLYYLSIQKEVEKLMHQGCTHVKPYD